MLSSKGITLIESIIALTILIIVFTVSSSGIIGALKTQGLNEAATSSQAKLRRITEVFTQELRGAVLGGLTNQPYNATSNSLSLILLDGGAGYEVQRDTTGDFASDNSLRIVAPVANASDLGLSNSQALMVSGGGQAVIFNVSDVQKVGGSSSNLYRVSHTDCTNKIAYQSNTLLFQVRTLGFEFDKNTGTLFQRENNKAPREMAFDLEKFGIRYVYQKNDGSIRKESEPFVDKNGTPLRDTIQDGDELKLVRLQITLEDSQEKSGKALERSYSSQVELSRNTNFNIGTVVPCK